MGVRGHDALGGRRPWPVHVPLSVPLPLPVAGRSVLLPLPVVGGLVPDRGGFALVLAGVLMQDFQGFGVRRTFGDGRASARFVTTFVSSGYFAAVRRKGIASR